jgi:hypothetical protein
MMRRSLLLVWLIALVMLTGCGGSGEGASPPTGAAPPQDEPIDREAECAFPDQMQVGRPATVRFSIFTPGNQPNALPSAQTEVDPLTLPERPGLETWVSVALNVGGAAITQQPARELQRLSETSNIWIWQITPQSAETVTIQPVVDVEFRDAAGNVIERESDVWTETYTVANVIDRGYLNLAGAWIGDSVQEIITGFIGALLLKLGTGTRQLVGRRLGKGNAA